MHWTTAATTFCLSLVQLASVSASGVHDHDHNHTDGVMERIACNATGDGLYDEHIQEIHDYCSPFLNGYSNNDSYYEYIPCNMSDNALYDEHIDEIVEFCQPLLGDEPPEICPRACSQPLDVLLVHYGECSNRTKHEIVEQLETLNDLCMLPEKTTCPYPCHQPMDVLRFHYEECDLRTQDELYVELRDKGLCLSEEDEGDEEEEEESDDSGHHAHDHDHSHDHGEGQERIACDETGDELYDEHIQEIQDYCTPFLDGYSTDDSYYEFIPCDLTDNALYDEHIDEIVEFCQPVLGEEPPEICPRACSQPLDVLRVHYNECANRTKHEIVEQLETLNDLCILPTKTECPYPCNQPMDVLRYHYGECDMREEDGLYVNLRDQGLCLSPEGDSDSSPDGAESGGYHVYTSVFVALFAALPVFIFQILG